MTAGASAVVTGAAQAFPPPVSQIDLWDHYASEHYGGDRWARKVFLSAGVEQRHAVANPCLEDLSGWSTGARMARYATDALPLGREAVTGALDAAGLDARDVGLLTVASCTGYSTPGLDIGVASGVGMADDVQRLFVGHMGCYAALPALGAVADFVVARGRPAVLLCVELASLHAQPPTTDLSQIVAHALFSDAAAAVVLVPGDRLSGSRVPAGGPATTCPGLGGDGLTVVDVTARTDASAAGHMTWDITDLGFRMGLSRRVPDVLATQIGPVVADLLCRNGVERDLVDGWAVHPGGPRILDVAGARLGLADGALDPSRAVLARHGNASSATVLLVIDEIRRQRPPRPGHYVVALAFGPGLTLYAVLLRAD